MRPFPSIIYCLAVFSVLSMIAVQVAAKDATRAAGTAGIDPALQKRLFAEGLPAWERTRKRYASAECTGRSVLYEAADAPLRPTAVKQFHVKIHGLNEILETAETRLAAGDEQNLLAAEPGAEFTARRVEGRNDRYEFLFGRKAANRPWRFSYVQRYDEPPQPNTKVKNSLDTFTIWMNINTQVTMIPLPVLFRDRGFTLVSVEPTAVGDHACVKIGFSYKPPAGQESEIPTLDGWLMFDPQIEWGMRAYDLEIGLPHAVFRIAGEVEYALQEELGERIPVARTIVSRTSGSAGLIGSRRVEMAQVRFRDIPPSEFRLAAYHLPEPDEPAPPRSLRGFYLIGAAAIMLASVTFFLGYRTASANRWGHEWLRSWSWRFAPVGLTAIICLPAVWWMESHAARQPAASLSWEAQRLLHGEAGRPLKLSITLKNESSASFQLLGARERCGRTACVELDNRFPQFPLVIPPKSERSFEWRVTPRRAGAFAVNASFYTDLPGQFEVSAVLSGTAHAIDAATKQTARSR